MSHRKTLQADALKLIARKLQSSLAVEGELPEAGLAAFGDDGDDLMMALARRSVSGEREDDSVNDVFAAATAAATSSAQRSTWWPCTAHQVNGARNGHGVAADAVLVGRVHGRRCGQAQSPQD